MGGLACSLEVSLPLQAGPRLVELNLREPTIPASSAYVH